MAFAITEGTIAGARPRAARADVGYGITRIDGIASYLGRTVAYDAIYRSQPHVRTVVDFLARQVASIKLGLYERLDDDERREVYTGPAAAFYRRPNPLKSRFAFYRDVVSDLAIYDRIFILKATLPGTGRPIGIRIPPAFMVPLGANWLRPESFALIATSGRPIELTADRVVYVHGYSPTDPRDGVPPMETLRGILAEDEAANEYRQQLWRNKARVSGVLTRPVDAPEWSSTARDRFLEEWRVLWSGMSSEAGGTPILEEGMSYEKIEATAVETEYLDARKLNRAEVAAAYHVNELLVGGSPTTGSSVTAEARRGMYADTLAPLLTFIAEELEVATFEDLDLDLEGGTNYLEHNLEAKLRGHFVDQAEVISRSVGAPWLTRNEARTMFNRPPVDGGDELIVPLNVVAGGRANPADTEPGTPGLGQASAWLEVDGELRPIFTAKAAPLELERGAKADAETPPPGSQLRPELKAWLEPTVTMLDRWAQRARRATIGRLRRGERLTAAFDADKWAEELTVDGLALATRQASDLGGRQLRELDGDGPYNVDGAAEWLEANARVFGEGATAALLEDLAAAYAGKSAKADDDGELETPPADRVDAAFATFAGGRMLVEAATRVTTVGVFAKADAAQQAGAGVKTWRTNSRAPRAAHAALNGVTVPIGETFPNGARWPGDPSLTADERAGCECDVVFGFA
jgi:HK97 family phage portal protein